MVCVHFIMVFMSIFFVVFLFCDEHFEEKHKSMKTTSYTNPHKVRLSNVYFIFTIFEDDLFTYFKLFMMCELKMSFDDTILPKSSFHGSLDPGSSLKLDFQGKLIHIFGNFRNNLTLNNIFPYKNHAKEEN